MITRLGLKGNIIAQKAAYLMSKHTKRPSCAIAGVYVDDITAEEIQRVLEKCRFLY